MWTSKTRKTQDFVRVWAVESRHVYSYILTLHPNSADADELFQETALTAWEKFGEFEPRTNFRAWCCTIARNKLRSFLQLRRHSTITFGENFADLVDGVIADKGEVLHAQQEALADCIAKLTSRDQRLVELRYRQEQSVKQIACHISRSADAVYKALARIRMALLDCVANTVARTE